MVLSESEAEARLAKLHREREDLDRAIGDLTLYLELGRRLRAGQSRSGPRMEGAVTDPQPPWEPSDVENRAAPPVERDDCGSRAPVAPTRHDEIPAPPAETTRPRDLATVGREPRETEGARLDGAPGTAEAFLSDGVLARRYGRALIEAAVAALEEAGRPLHAGEILAVLTRRGFALPGHDPIAALNTRLWKRSGPGGPFRRMGDAVYALAETESDSGHDRAEGPSGRP